MKTATLFVVWLTTLFLLSTTVFAAMDPAEVKKVNAKAPFQITGKVIQDELVKDLSEEKDGAYQLRKMKISIDEIIKSDADDAKVTSVDVYYMYLPSWRAMEYTGGKPMDITVNDVIKIWLDKGQYGWEPVLSGYSVEHIKYIEDRIEPIPEPFFHYMERKMKSNVQHNSSGVVITGIVFSIVILLFIGFRKRRIG